MRIKILIINLFLTSSLLSDTIIFNDGLMIQGELIKVMKKHPYGPNTETEQAILFKVDKYNLNRVPKSLVINKTTDNVLMFDISSIYKIEYDNGMLIYSSNKKWFSPRIFQKTTSDLEIFSTDLILSKTCSLLYSCNSSPYFSKRVLPTSFLNSFQLLFIKSP